MLQRGEITDSMSVIALLHEAVRRREGRHRGRVRRSTPGGTGMRRRGCESMKSVASVMIESHFAMSS